MPKIKLNIKRPSWESVKKAYMEINMANQNDENLQRIFRQAIIDNGVWRGIPAKKAEQIANEEIDKITNNNYDDFVWQRYALVGGEPLKEYINHKNFFGRSYKYADYSNTCALQVSYALNYGGMLLHTKIKKGEYKSMQGHSKEYLYILGADYMGRFLEAKWGKAEISVTATDDGKPMVLEQIKDKNGIVVMKGYYSHTTLWNGKNFVDVENDRAGNYYLTDIGTAKLGFWELK